MRNTYLRLAVTLVLLAIGKEIKAGAIIQMQTAAEWSNTINNSDFSTKDKNVSTVDFCANELKPEIRTLGEQKTKSNLDIGGQIESLNDSSDLFAKLTSSGSGQKTIIWDPVYDWQQITYHCDVNLEFGVTFNTQRGDIYQYTIVGLRGTVHFWGTAEDQYYETHNTWNFDDTHNFDLEYPSEGLLEYSASKQRVTYVQSTLSSSPGDVVPYYIQYFGLAHPYSVRTWIDLPSDWYFSDDYNNCDAGMGVDMTDSVILSPRAKITYDSAKFQYNSGTPGNWRMVSLSAYVQAEFKLNSVPGSAKLVIDHLSSYVEGCPGGGYSPVDIIVNGNTVAACYDPASHHGGYHGFVTDEWNIGGYLHTGTNTIRVQICNTACSHYWIRYLYIDDLGNDCASSVLESIKDVNVNLEKNMMDHMTSKFNINGGQYPDKAWKQPKLILRRGSMFDVMVRLSKLYDPSIHHIDFIAEHTFDGDINTIKISNYSTEPWKCTELSRELIGDDWLVHMLITIPITAPVGQYTFKANIKNTSSPTVALFTKEFPMPVVILFNPWNTADTVYMNSTLCEEYVLMENGCMWVWNGPLGEPKDWDFQQFQEVSLDVALDLLTPDANSTARTNPILISRILSDKDNWNDFYGVIDGNWSGNYIGGTEPWIWSGSQQIFKQYMDSGSPVKFGQCWVFAGVLTSVLRTLGIPARPVTNFESTHDYPIDSLIPYTPMIVDKIFTRDLPPGQQDPKRYIDFGNGVWLDKKLSEKIWNFHVWCEAWMRRTDRPSCDGWQVVDGTPMELDVTDNHFKIGPAPVIAVKNEQGGSYDVNFIVSEVHIIEQQQWFYTIDEYGEMQFEDIPHEIKIIQTGLDISTKKLGILQEREDITANYKSIMLMSPLERYTLNGIEDISANLAGQELVPIGSDLAWTLTLQNNSTQVRTISVALSALAISYDGSMIDMAGKAEAIVVLGPNEINDFTLNLGPSQYLTWLNSTQTYECWVCFEVNETGEVYLDSKRTILTIPKLAMQILPDVNMYPGKTATCEISWTNPLLCTLHNVKINGSVGHGLSLEGQNESQILIGDVNSGQIVHVYQQVAAIETGIHLITVNLQNDELAFVDGATYLHVVFLCDYDKSGHIDLEDLAILADQWLYSPGVPSADIWPLGGDGIVNFEDFTVLAEHWLETVQ